MRIKQFLKSNIFIILILVFALFLYIHFMMHDTLSPDEALYAWNAKQVYENPFIILSLDFLQNDPFVLLVVAFFDVFLLQEFAARLVIVLFALLGVLLIYLLGKEMKNKDFGALAALFLILNPWYWMLSNRILLDVPLTTMIILNAYFLFKLYKTKNSLFLYLSLISLILVILTKLAGVMILPVNIIVLYFVYFKDFGSLKRWLYCIVSLFLPMIFMVFLFWDKISRYLSYVSVERFLLNYPVVNNVFDILLGYVPSQVYLFFYIVSFAFIIFLIYKMIVFKQDRFIFLFILLFLCSILIFRTFFGAVTVVRYLLPLVPFLLLLIIFVLYQDLVNIKNRFNIRNIYIVILIIILIILPLLVQGIQINKFTSYSKTGFNEAGIWLGENIDSEKSIIFAGNPMQIRYYSGFDCAQEDEILVCYSTNKGIPFKRDFITYIEQNPEQTIFLQMDFREKYQPGWIKRLDSAEDLKLWGFELAYVVTKKQPFYMSPPTQAKTEFLESFNITPYEIFPGDNIIFPPGIEAYAGNWDNGAYLEELGFKKADSLFDYMGFAFSLEDTYMDQPVVLIFKRDPINLTEN